MATGDGRRLFQLISIISRRSGLLELDPSSRKLFDIIVARELSGQVTTARDLLDESDLSRALLYRRLLSLKEQGWIMDVWRDQKLTYSVTPKFFELTNDLMSQLKIVDAN